MNMFLALRLPREMHLWSSHASHGAETATKPSLTFLLTFGKVQNPLRLPHKITVERPKVDRNSWFRNVLHAATACTHSTSQLPKVLWLWRALQILTSQCASRHNGVHFFNISLSKVFCIVWHVWLFRAAFSTSQLLKVFRTWCVLQILTSQRASHHNAVHFFDMSTSKSAPTMRVLLAFWLPNLLRATAACNF